MDTLGEWLINHATNEPSIAANVEVQKAELTELINAQQEKIDKKYLGLQDLLLHGQEFDDNCKDLNGKLDDLERKIATLRPVSLIYDTLKLQKIDGDSLKDNIMKYEPVYTKVVEEGEKMIEDMEPGEEKYLFVENLSTIKSRLGTMNLAVYKFFDFHLV